MITDAEQMIDFTRRSRRRIEIDVDVSRRDVRRLDDEAYRYVDTWSIEECEDVARWDRTRRETG